MNKKTKIGEIEIKKTTATSTTSHDNLLKKVFSSLKFAYLNKLKKKERKDDIFKFNSIEYGPIK